MSTLTRPRDPSQQGFSLVEVLVALLVLSIGLLGLALLQVEGMKLNSDAYLRTQATVLAYDILDRLRANKSGADSGNYCLNGPGTTADKICSNAKPTGGNISNCGDTTSGCGSPADLAKYDLTQWYDMMARRLPLSVNNPPEIRREQVTSGTKTVNRYTVLMRWIEHDLLIEQRWVAEI